MRGFSVVTGLGLLFFPLFAGATAITTVYYAGNGTLPEAQGFTANVDAPIAPSISNGILHVDAYTQGDPFKEGYYTDVNGTFLFSSFVMEAGLQIINSDIHGSPSNGTNYARAGFILEASDNTGVVVQLELAENKVWMQSPTTGSIAAVSSNLSFDTTNGYHDYRVVGSGGVLSLYIDHSPTSALTFSVASLSSSGAPADQFLFGDASFLTRSNYNLQYALFSSDINAQFSAPEPAAIVLLPSALGVFWLMRRRRRA